MMLDVIPAPVAQFAVRLTVLLTAATIADRLMRKRTSAAARHLLWTSAVAAALLLPVFAFSLPKLAVPVATRRVHLSAQPADSKTTGTPLPVVKEPLPREAERLPLPATPGVSYALLLVGIYALGVFLVTARLLRDEIAARHLVRDAVALSGARWASSPVPVRMTGEELPPLTIGVRNPTIVVPRSAELWNDDRRSAVLLHELAHVKRQDCATQIVAAIACACYWPHPLIWLAAARMRFERELACDDAVLDRGMPATDYAAHLLEIARGLSRRRTPAVAVSMAAHSQLERRLRAVIEARRPRGSLRRNAVVAAVACTLGAVLPLSSLMATTRVEVIPAPPRAKTESSVVAEPTVRGQFNVWLNTEKSEGADTVVHLTLFIPGSMGIIGADYLIKRFDGLTTDQLRNPASELRFRLVSNAGTIGFRGVMQGHDGNGSFEFQADSAYNADLRRRGLRISESEQIAFALSGRSASDVSSRSALVEPTPRPRPVARTDSLQVQPQPTPAERPSPLDGTWRASPGRASSLRLDIEWSDVNQWFRFVEPAELTAIPGGFKYRADAGEITFWGDLNDRRGSGTMLFSPNRAFADTLARLGVGDAASISTHDLKNFAFYGMNASVIREFIALGVGPMDKGGVLTMAIFGVTPEFARLVRAAGERDLSPENLVSLKRGGRPR